MPDDRPGISNTNMVGFRSLDRSGSVAETPNRKNSREYYMRPGKKEEEEEKAPEPEFVDRSAQLRATLNSLAMLNVVRVIKKKDIKDQE